MGHKPIVKPDAGAYPNREAGERKRLTGKETRAGLIGRGGKKAALKTHGRG